MSGTNAEVEAIEIDLLLEGIFRRYGYDFRDYTRCTLERRMAHFASDAGCATISEVTGRMLHDTTFFHRLLPYFMVSVTSLFRDATFYAALRSSVVPLLRTWPHFKIWHAGCATGEECYSMAIVLREAGLLRRARLYGTDIHAEALATAASGIYPLDTVREGSARYLESGGKGSLSDHYHADANAAILNGALGARITFAQHNLVTDQSFGEMQVVICRNVLIHFGLRLQDRALALLAESLCPGGLLCLGESETLMGTAVADAFVAVDDRARIYKKRVA